MDPTIARAASQAMGVFTPPEPLADDTGLVRTTVLALGELKVIQWIHTSRPMSTLRVTVPPVVGLDEGDVTVSHLFAGGDGTVVHTQRVAGPRASWRGDLSGAHNAYVSYDLSGVVTPILGGPGRTAALITSLDVSVGKSLVRATRELTGPGVLALDCTADGTHGLPQPCGAASGGVWRVALGRYNIDDPVMARLAVG